MPNYEEIIQQSQENVKALSDKLKDLEKLHQDILELKKAAENIQHVFAGMFQEVVKLTETYTNALGASTKKYLDGNNTLFATKLSELGEKTKELQKEISRLVDTDFTKLFLDLQKTFIEQTRKDLAEELKKLDSKSQDLQTKIEELKKQVTRLEQIDLEKHFAQHQKTLSEIFGAVNTIQSTLSTITGTLTEIIRGLGTIQNSLDTNFKETKQQISNFSEATSKHLDNQDNEAKRNVEVLESILKSLIEQNEILKKEIKASRIIQIVGLAIILIILTYVASKSMGG